jgi:hypothetical protein
MNETFNKTIEQSIQGENPNQARFGVVSQFFHSRQNTNDIGNLIFIYLLSQDNEKVKKILYDIFQYSKEIGARWIKMGQENGVIPANIDADKMAALFMTFSYGLRVTQILTTAEDDKIESSDIFKVIIKTLS